MKKINLCLTAHLYPAVPSDYKGVFVRDLAEALARKGVAVHVVTPMRPGAVPCEVTGGIHVHRFRFSGWKKGRQLGQVKGLPIFMLGTLVLAGIIHLLRVAKRHKINLFHAYWIVPGGFMAAVAGRITRTPVVATAAGSDLNIASANRRIAPIATFTLRHLAALIAVSRPLIAKAADLGMPEADMVHIPGPVGMDMQAYAAPACRILRGDDPLKLIYVGNLEAPKRVDTLIRAAARLKSQGVNFHLTIAGTGPLENPLKQTARDLVVDDCITFMGRVTHDQIPNLLQAGHVFWHCSENEGLPVAIMEAMAAGLPVIAAGVGGIPELVHPDRTGFCLQYEDDAGFADKTRILYDRDPVRQAMGSRAREQVDRQYNQQTIIEQNLALYRRVLKRRASEDHP
jgi:glycosyltransferase involved in cell wall biosynthesis